MKSQKLSVCESEV